VVAVRWYLRYGRSYRDLEEPLTEMGLANPAGVWLVRARLRVQLTGAPNHLGSWLSSSV
jgi:hypothetical protein